MRYGLALVLSVTIVGCVSSERLPAARNGAPSIPPSVENLNATLWAATSVEYGATALQSYRQARLMLDRALVDTAWTALPAQTSMQGFGGLPPAVILDVDETVLDNTTYQARLIRDRQSYSGATWTSWVQEASAPPVPGALEFTLDAAARGIQVIYLTNRDADGEEATRRNLQNLGFPLEDHPDAVLTQGERPEWQASDKEPRRLEVGYGYRILLLIGDNLADFVSTSHAGLEARRRLFTDHSSWWGTRWIMLPNPQYGSWESATFDNDYGLSPAERMNRKMEVVRRRADS